jgi:hypothetical protein
MKLAFCGDSYCGDIEVQKPRLSYLDLVSKEFDAEILCYGEGGGCLFHSYEIMLNNIEEADYIIFCVTEPYRFANRYRLPINAPSIFSGYYEHGIELRKKTLAKIKAAMEIYYKEIISHRYHEITQRGLLREIDAVIKEYKKKCIFFGCFENSFQDYTFKNAPWGNLHLFEDIQQITEQPMTRDELDYARSNLECNHFFQEDNINMANFIIDVIKEDNFTPREIKMDKYFTVTQNKD